MGLIADGAILQNEVKNWPSIVRIGTGLDLVTNNLWWDTVGTPTTEATAVPASGEAGLEAKWTEVIKCVTDAANEGFKQRYTYADEPRIKSGAVISALAWVAHASGVASCDVTVKLVNSDASETVGTVIASTTDWECHLVEGHTCAGTHVDLQVTKDTAGTFYAGGPITVMLGASAIGLPPRKTVERWYDGDDDTPNIKTLTGLADEATWTDIDVTASTSALATKAIIHCILNESGASNRYDLFARRNGTAGAGVPGISSQLIIAMTGVAELQLSVWPQILDDNQVFEYFLDRNAGATTLDFGEMYLRGYEEWE